VTKATAIEPKQERYDDWYARSQAELKQLVWSSPYIEHSFYKNSDGDIHSLSPWRLVDFWSWTRTPEFEDFVVT
jgi:4-hydroxyacetophenone monooxygenase